MPEIHGFERFINSTFGLPQQLLFRTLRAIQDPNVDFFSEEGILDAALIPVAGFWDKDRQDVQAQEIVQRTGKVFGQEWEGDSFGGQLAAGIFTDPLTYLTGGLTALGRGGKALNKGLATRAGREALKTLPANAPLSAVTSALEAAIKVGTPAKEARKLTKAVGALKEGALKEFADTPLSSAKKFVRDRELRVSAPFFNMAGKGIYHTQEYGNWMSLVGKNIPGISPAAASIGKGLAKVPVVSSVFHSLGGIKVGWNVSGLSALKIAGGTLPTRNLDALDGILSPEAISINKRLSDKGGDNLFQGFEGALDKGATPNEAFVKSIMGKRGVDPEQVDDIAAEGLAAMGLQSADDITPGTLDEFVGRHQESVSDITARATRTQLDKSINLQRKEYGDTFGFKFGKTYRDWTRKFFNASTPVRSLIAGEKEFRSITARATEAMQRQGRLLHEATLQDATKLGMSPVEAEQFFMMRLQGDVLHDELAETARMLGLTGNKEAFAQGRDNLALRLTRLSDLVGGFAEKRPEMQAMAKQYRDLAEAVGPGSKFRAFYEEAGEVKFVGEAPPLGGSLLNQRPVRVGKKGQAVHLGNINDDGLATITRRYEKAGTRPMQKHEVMFTIREDPIFTRLADQHGLSADDLAHNLSRARKAGGIRYLTRAKIRPPHPRPTGTPAPARIKLSDEQVAHFQDVAKLSEERFTTFDVRQLTPAQRDEYRDVKALQELRASGKEARLPKSKAPVEVLENEASRSGSSIWAETPPSFKGDSAAFANIPEGADAIARLQIGAKEIGRAKVVTPALLDELNQAAIEASRAFTGPIDEMLDAAGATSFRNVSDTIRKNILSEAIEHNLLAAGSPLGYVGRIISRSQTKAISELLGADEVRTVLSDAMPQLSGGFARNVDALPIEDLNQAIKVLGEAENPAAQAIGAQLIDIAKEEGLVLGKYEASPAQALLSRLAQGETTYTVAQSADTMINAATRANQIVSGRVVRTLHGAGKKIATEIERLNSSVKGIKSKAQTLEITAEESAQRMSGLIVRQDDGLHRFIPFNAVGSRGGLLPLGGKGALHQALTAGTGNAAEINKVLDGQKVSDMFALRAARGKFEPNEILEQMTDATITGLDGQHVIFGDKQVIGGMFNATQLQWKHTGEMAAAYDTATFAVKKWQTVYRPGFHITNRASAFFQARALGVGAKAASMGMYDAMRFMHGDPKLAAVYDQMSLHVSSADGLTGIVKRRQKGVPTLEFLRTIRGAGREGIKGPSPEAMAKFGVTGEDLLFTAGGQTYDIGEILDVMAREGLFSTFTNQGLRGSSSTSEAIFKLRKDVLDPSFFAKAGQAVDPVTEASEAFARLSVTFAQLREGVDLEHAVINAKRATVDYAQLTEPEQHLKRFINFYTFPRHYIPVAAKHFAEDPAALSRVSNFLKSAKGTGVTNEENGNVTLNVDGLLRNTVGYDPETGIGLNASRINPNLETVKYLEAFGEIMLNTADEASELVGGRGVAAARAERLSGQTGQPFSLGSIPSAAFAAFDENKSALKEMSDAFWTTRIMFAPDDPLEEQTTMTRLLDGVLLGTKTGRPEHEAKVIEYRYEKAISNLTKKATETTDASYQRELQAEAQRLQSIARDRISKIRK